MDLTEFDFVIISTSGGKDSQAMLSMVHRLAVEQGCTDRLRAVHADLGRAEWPGVTDLVERQCAMLGIPLEIVRRPQGDLVDQIRARGMFPSSAARYCTSDQKRGQIQKVYTRLSRASGGQALRILECVGIRSQESSKRAKLPEIERKARASSKTREVISWLPLKAWTVEDVWAEIERSGLPHHPAYDAGMPRLSCAFCIMANRGAVTLSASLNPDLLAEYVALEKEIEHDFRSDWSLADIANDLAAGKVPERVQDWTM